jgi:hypothetical protein
MAFDAGRYGSYTQAIDQGNKMLESAAGRATTQGGYQVNMAGSEAAGIDASLSNLKQQRQFDPWGFYRGAAADRLASSFTEEDPSNIFRSKLTGMLNGEFSPDDPSYQFRFQQGQQALERSQGARGLLNSGNAAIELQQYGQGAASQEFQAQFERVLQGMLGVEKQYDTQQSRLMELAGIGNAGIGLSKQKLDQDVMDNLNYQMGLASAANQSQPRSVGFGSGAF